SVTESCQPITMPGPMTKDTPFSPTLMRTCNSTVSGVCPNPGEVCVPPLPKQNGQSQGPSPKGWTYCVQANRAPGKRARDPASPYPVSYVFGWSEPMDDRHCTQCSCDPPVGSMCTSYVTVYSDGACAVPLDMVKATLAGPACLDFSAAAPLGS